MVIHHLETGAVVNRRQVLLRHGHANGHTYALAQRACGHLYAIGIAALRVARRPRSPLPEALQVVQRHLVPGEKQHGIKQRRGVPIRQHETVPVRPLSIRRIVLHQLVIEQVCDGRAAQRSAGMAALGLLYRIDGKQPQCVDGQLVESL